MKIPISSYKAVLNMETFTLKELDDKSESTGTHVNHLEKDFWEGLTNWEKLAIVEGLLWSAQVVDERSNNNSFILDKLIESHGQRKANQEEV